MLTLLTLKQKFVWYLIIVVVKANYFSIKHRFVNLGVFIIYLLTIFLKEPYVKILTTVKWVIFHGKKLFYGFSPDYSLINKGNILIIHEYFMEKGLSLDHRTCIAKATLIYLQIDYTIIQLWLVWLDKMEIVSLSMVHLRLSLTYPREFVFQIK